ncbi:hypothetical protein BC829DRAFT_20461 [Chytridium lagenaria]|nr:hypothetical protein BC829DRAFT_20461 [Chytridium lagenaria]
MKRLIEAGGGKVMNKLRLRNLRNLESNALLGFPEASSNQSPTSTPDKSRVICVTCETDSAFHAAMKEQGLKLYSVELILMACLRQALDLNDSSLWL